MESLPIPKTSDSLLLSTKEALRPFASRFDRAISGDSVELTSLEIEGFNLFMGKGKCGTCHFAPIFNGTVPPHYTDSELEVIGVPSTAKWENAEIDPDTGRFALFGAALKKFAFKTPTVRNIAYTSPYMHNGVYNTLEEVVRFYNVGGGVGIGIDIEHQTLPFDSLQLTYEEQKAIVAFMKALSDPLTDEKEYVY